MLPDSGLSPPLIPIRAKLSFVFSSAVPHFSVPYVRGHVIGYPMPAECITISKTKERRPPTTNLHRHRPYDAPRYSTLQVPYIANPSLEDKDLHQKHPIPISKTDPVPPTAPYRPFTFTSALFYSTQQSPCHIFLFFLPGRYHAAYPPSLPPFPQVSPCLTQTSAI